MPGLDAPQDFAQWMRWVERRLRGHDWRITGVGARAGSGGGGGGGVVPPPTMETFTASGTWTKPAGASRVRVRIVGGGGAGGGAGTTVASQQSVGAGGGGGGYVEKTYDAAVLGATEAFVIGAAGTPAAGASGNPGGTTTFAGLSAGGGGGGIIEGAATTIGTSGTGGAAGTATGGDLNVPGGAGAPAMRNGSATANPLPGNGGDTPLGEGGRAQSASTGGLAGSGYGGGGGGGGNAQSQGTARSGGAGAPGVVIIETFFGDPALDIPEVVPGSGIIRNVGSLKSLTNVAAALTVRNALGSGNVIAIPVASQVNGRRFRVMGGGMCFADAAATFTRMTLRSASGANNGGIEMAGGFVDHRVANRGAAFTLVGEFTWPGPSFSTQPYNVNMVIEPGGGDNVGMTSATYGAWLTVDEIL